MPRGGKRVRSGPMPDPSSGASERRGYTLRSLPNTEYKGRPPKFPLPPYVIRYFDKDSQEWIEDTAGSESWNDREAELWKQLWRLPQARAWKQPQLRYLHYQIASYVRECVICESSLAKAASVSGQIPASMSEQGSVAVTTSKGKGYSGKTSADTFYMQLMHMLKYATKDIERHLGGDFNGSAQVNVSKAETNVTRALVKAANAASIDLGSYVSVGTGTDRGDNKTGEAAAYRKVISKTVVDSATTAINVSGAAFTTTTAMHVTQMPYLTGSTDGVLGNDGIPREDVSKTHQPIRLQGIELFAGVYETEGDIILKNVKDSDTSGHTEVWKVFDTTKASGTAITADYVHVGDYPPVNDKTDNQWQWQTDFTEKHGFLLPTGVGATSTSGLTDALIINPISAPGLHELRRGGDLWDGSRCGLFGALGGGDLSGAWWACGGRLSVLGRTHA